MSSEVSSSEVMSNPQAGLSNEDYCYLKCWVALVRVGKKVLAQILSWGFPNQENVSLKEGLTLLPGYSNTKYKNDFNREERSKIEDGVIADFDITLLHTITQRLCRLIPASSQISAHGTSVDKLSDLLLKVKNTRNKFAHPLLGLTEIDMKNHINEMMALFELTIAEAVSKFQVDLTESNNFKNDVSSQLLDIVHSPLPASTISSQLEQIAKEKTRIVIQEAIKDFQQSYKHHSEISVTPWPFVPLRKNVQDVFIKTKLRYLSSYIFQNGLTEDESAIAIDKILSVVHLDLSEPNFLLLTGMSGVGKSTLMKYIICSWLSSSLVPTQLTNIDQFDLVFYVDCRNTCLTSINNLFLQLIPNTATLFSDEELLKIVLGLKCLFLVDNIDETSTKSLSFINELIATSCNVKIIATATQDPGNLIFQKAQTKRPLSLCVTGLSSDSTIEYVTMLYESLPENLRNSDIEKFQYDILSKEYLLENWLCNPEILSHIFFNWLFAPEKSSRCSTLTHVLLQSFNLILKKLLDKLSSKSLAGVMEVHVLNVKLQTFLLELGRIATSSLKDGSTGLGFKSTSQLLAKCQELGLPANLLLSEFLCFRESFDEKLLQSSVRVVFPSVSFQEFCSAYHLYTLLENNNRNRLRKLLDIDSLEANNRNKARVTNIIRFLIGLMATNNPSIIDTFSSQFVELLQNFCQLKNSSQWFQMLEEAQGHVTLTKAVLDILNGNWEIMDHGISNLIVELISSSPPKNLSVVTVKEPEKLPHLQNLLETCRRSPHSIKLSLYIYSHFWKFDDKLSDHYLKLVCGDGSNSQLQNFAGRLSVDCLNAVPKSILRLALRIAPEEIEPLNVLLPTFHQLQLLSLNLILKEGFDYEKNPPVQLNNNRDTMLSLELFGMSFKNLSTYCNVVAKVSRIYTRIGLRRTSFTFDSSKQFLSELCTLEVTVQSLVIGSIIKLKKHEQVNLKTFARDCIGCKEFKWIEL